MSQCQSSGAFLGSGGLVLGGDATVTTTCPAMAEDNATHISGLATFHLTVVPSFDGGQVFIEMQDSETGIRLGHATMDVRYHAGGYDAQTVIPGQTITMLMEFQGIDAILPAGHGITFVLSESGEDYLPPACTPSCSMHIIPSVSTVEIPVIYRDGSNVLITPQGEDAANNQ
jgi:hypothetical protein